VSGYALTPTGLLGRREFRRFLFVSVMGHVLLGGGLMLAPAFQRAIPRPQPLFVDLVALPEPAKAAPAPPKKSRQKLEQPLVLKPKPKPKPKPELVPPKVEKPKEPPKPAEPEAPPTEEEQPVPSAAELLAQIREKVGTEPQEAEAAPKALPGGRADPLLAAYRRQVTTLLRSNWGGAASWTQEGLLARFEAQIDASGRIRSLSRLRSSGNWVFDDAAERAIWSSQPFPSPPRGPLTLDLVFNPKGVF
jgi:TonB family protein